MIQIRVVCSKGTYIRALARDIGEALGFAVDWDPEGVVVIRSAEKTDDSKDNNAGSSTENSNKQPSAAAASWTFNGAGFNV